MLMKWYGSRHMLPWSYLGLVFTSPVLNIIFWYENCLDILCTSCHMLVMWKLLRHPPYATSYFDDTKSVPLILYVSLIKHWLSHDIPCAARQIFMKWNRFSLKKKTTTAAHYYDITLARQRHSMHQQSMNVSDMVSVWYLYLEGIYQAWYTVEIRHSGWEPSISNCKGTATRPPPCWWSRRKHGYRRSRFWYSTTFTLLLGVVHCVLLFTSAKQPLNRNKRELWTDREPKLLDVTVLLRWPPAREFMFPIHGTTINHCIIHVIFIRPDTVSSENCQERHKLRFNCGIQHERGRHCSGPLLRRSRTNTNRTFFNRNTFALLIHILMIWTRSFLDDTTYWDDTIKTHVRDIVIGVLKYLYYIILCS